MPGEPEPTKGERTRAAIVQQAARLATVEGIERLSIGKLAKATGMSKAGLYAHFGSKAELQLATIAAAREIFVEEVIRPGLAEPRGVRRLLALCEAFLLHVEREVFPGGCFFSAAAVEVGTRRDRIRDAVAEQQEGWMAMLERVAEEARLQGELDDSVDAAQLAFELNALVVATNNTFILQGEPEIVERGRAAVRSRIDTARVSGAAAFAEVTDPE